MSFELFSNTMSTVLRDIISVMQTPVVVILLALMVVTVVVLGSFVCEWITEHRSLKQSIPTLLEELNKAPLGNLGFFIEKSHILKRQKAATLKVVDAKGMDADSREAYAAQLLFDEDTHYRKKLRLPHLIMRLAPMFGLLGTLIPLGPGLMALGQGNTQVLSQSLLVAFDTTSAGIIVAAVALVVYQLRKSWYRSYAQGLESVMDVVLNRMRQEGDSNAA